VLAPPPFPGSSFIDFDRHTEVYEAAYRWCNLQLDQLAAQGHPALAAIFANKD
jgi:predicted acylesterase/phospholipase RssA